MTRLELVGVSDGPLLLAAGTFTPACSVIYGDDTRSLAALVAVASGAKPAARGRALLDGVALESTPAARRRVASLLEDEALPVARSVAESVARVQSARREARSADALLAAFGLAAWSRRPPQTLDRDERRSLGLALALAHEQAALVVLHEPFSTSSVEASAVTDGIARARSRGAVVLLATASLELAGSLGGPHCYLTRGVLTSETPATGDTLGAAHALPDASAARPADQRVAMPTAFAEPTRPRSNGESA